MENLLTLTQRLSDASVKRYNNPYSEFDWPCQLNRETWHFSPDLISIAGTPAYEGLSERQKQQLSFWEAVNFFSLNIHGEKALLQGLSQRLYADWPEEISDYLHHFVDEENKHMTLFGTFCLRYGNKIYPSKTMIIPREFKEGEADFLFFAKVVIFEELVDYFNFRMSKDDELHPLTRKINRYHHDDEVRHLSFGRTITKRLFEKYAPRWDAQTRRDISDYLSGYMSATWREYYNPAVYRDAGLADTYQLYQAAWNSEHAQMTRAKATSKCLRFFLNNEILMEAPQL